MEIDISRYPVFIKLGVFKEEQIMGQEVLVSVKVHVNLKDLSLIKDELSRTLDYGKIFAALDDILQDKAFRLVETVVDKVGRGLLQRFPPITGVEVRIEKPLLPRGVGKGARLSLMHKFYRE